MRREAAVIRGSSITQEKGGRFQSDVLYTTLIANLGLLLSIVIAVSLCIFAAGMFWIAQSLDNAIYEDGKFIYLRII